MRTQQEEAVEVMRTEKEETAEHKREEMEKWNSGRQLEVKLECRFV